MLTRLILTTSAIALLGGGAFLMWGNQSTAPSLPAGESPIAQEADYTIGLLGFSSTIETVFDEFRKTMDQLAQLYHFSVDYVVVNIPRSEQNVERGIDYLIGERVDLIVTGQGEIPALLQKTRTIPIISALASNPVAAGLAESDSGSGNNVVFIRSGSVSTASKRLELFLSIVPTATRILVPRGVEVAHRGTEEGIKQLRDIAAQRNIALIDREFETRRDLNRYLLEVDPDTFDAIFRYADPFIAANADVLFGLARNMKPPKPIIGLTREELARGALMSYSAHYNDLGRRAAHLAYQILVDKQAPGEMPTQAADTFFFGVNLSVAERLGINIPQSVVERAQDIVE